MLSLTTGCGEGDSGVIVRATTETPGVAPVEKPLQAVTGDNDAFPDIKLTPSSFTVAFTHVRLIEATDLDTDPIQTHTVFERDPSDPIEISLTTGEVEEVEESNREPQARTYNLIEYGVRYFEMTIPLCEADDDCENRRVRYYLTTDALADPVLNFTPQAREILISRSPTGDLFSWIYPELGLPLSLNEFPITGQRPPEVYQVPLGVFPATGPSPIFRQPLSPPLEVEENPDEVFVFTLRFDLTDLFFFDNTDGETEPVRFNARVDNLDLSRDGKILNGCASPPICTADFWPGLPDVTVTVEREERD